MELEKKSRSLKKVIKTFIESIKLLHKLDKGLVTYYALIGLMVGAKPFVNIYALKLIINAISAQKTFKEVFILALATVVLNLLLDLTEKFLGHHAYFRMELMTEKRDMEFGRKNTTIDYEFLEDPNLHIELDKMYNMDYNGGFGLWNQLVNCMELVQNTFLFISGIILAIPMYKTYAPIFGLPLFAQNIIFTLLVLFICFLQIRINSVSLRRMDKFEKSDVFEKERPYSYAVDSLLDYKMGKDIRLYNSELYKGYFETQNEFDKMVNRTFRILRLPAKLSLSFFNIIGLLVVYLFVGLKAYYEVISVGDIVQYAGAVTQFVFAISGLTTVFNDITNNCDFFDLCLGFINLSETKYSGTQPIEKRDGNQYEFEFRNVSFRYPGTEKCVLKNINLKLKAGERLAVVGMNGSGKTTFIKLLVRLYDPSEGEILLNGVTIKQFDYDEYLNLLAVVFQDFSLFSFKLGQNVVSGLTYDKEKALRALNAANFVQSLEKMPEDLDSYLYNDYEDGGMEISGGEAQKIAMARAIYKDAPFIILDEPTAALDPISESEIYSGFDKIVGSKTAIYISHRLSSCRFCDTILVFDHGEIVQTGSHDELVQNKAGKYYELWNAQAQYYRGEEIRVLLS